MKNIIISVMMMSTLALGVKTYTVNSVRENHALGLKRDAAKHRLFVKSAKHMELPALGVVPVVPGNVDLSDRVSPPENQGQCGSCWDFSLTKALRSSLMIAGIDPGTLAFNYLLNNCGPGPSQGGCNGGDFDAGQSFLNSSGPWLESQDPYRQSEGRCKSGLATAGTALEFVSVGSGNRRPTFRELAIAIAATHVLSIDVAVCGDWGSYSGGIFNDNQCGANSINHMINQVGYSCETSVDAQGNCVFDSNGQPKNGDGYLKVMNNWGEFWGEKGYMRTRYGVDAIADTAMYFVVKAPPPPPVPVPVNAGLPLWVFIALGGAGIVIVLLGVLLFKKKA